MNYKEISVSSDNKSFEYKGKNLFLKEFNEVLKFHTEGLAPVCDDSGWYHIDLNGEAVYRERYDRAFGYYCGKAAVIKAGKWFHIDTKGLRIGHRDYLWCGNYQEDLCTVRLANGKYQYVDSKGDFAFKGEFFYAGDYKDGIACVKVAEGEVIHIDRNGNVVNGKAFLDLGVFHKSYATARDQEGWHHINVKGQELYSERYLAVEPFYNGQALVETFEHEKVVIDEAGKVVLAI